MDSVATTRRIFDLLQRGAVDEVVELIDDDFFSNEAQSLPYGGIYRGKSGFVELLGLLGKTWDDFDFKIHDIVGSGDTAAVLETIYGSAGGTRFEMAITEIWRYRDGKVIEATPYYHDTKLLADLHAARSS